MEIVKTKPYKIVLMALVGLVGIYIALDRQLAYYGLNNINMYRDMLPLKIYAEHWRDLESGFSLFDEDGFSLAGKGVRYKDSDVKIDKILRYGIDKHSIVVFVTDARNQNFVMEISDNKDANSRDLVSVKIKAAENVNRYQGYRWFEISDEHDMKTLGMYRFLCFLFAIAMIVWLVKLVRKRNASDE